MLLLMLKEEEKMLLMPLQWNQKFRSLKKEAMMAKKRKKKMKVRTTRLVPARRNQVPAFLLSLASRVKAKVMRDQDVGPTTLQAPVMEVRIATGEKKTVMEMALKAHTRVRTTGQQSQLVSTPTFGHRQKTFQMSFHKSKRNQKATAPKKKRKR